MYMIIGKDAVICADDVIGAFDLDKNTVFKVNRNYLSNAEKKGNIVTVTDNLPKSYIVCENKESKEEKVYLSRLLTSTLLKRDLIYTDDLQQKSKR